MRPTFVLLAGLLFCILCNSCGTINKPYISKEFRDWRSASLPDSSKLNYSVYLVGDGGDMVPDDPILEVLHKRLLAETPNKSAIAYMGDNIYLHGMPPEDAPDRERKEEVIKAQMSMTDDYEGQVIFLPGNHDWDYSGPNGLEYINRQEDYIEDYYGNKDVFHPDNGCPGPSVIQASDKVTIIVVDSEWWLEPYHVPHAPENGCTVESKLDLIIQLEDAVRRNKNKNIVIIAHHPLISNGNHGGHFNLLDNIFPLRLVRDNLYIPLPLVGSLYPLLRKAGVSPEDIPNSTFQQYKSSILSVISDMPNVIYASGHDHNLELHKAGLTHQVISGSVSKTNFAAKGFNASFVQQKKGFSIIRYYSDGQVWIEFYYVDDQHKDGELSFKAPLYALDPSETTASEKEEIPDYQDSTKTMPANPDYTRGKVSAFFLGEHYRKEWTTPVKLKYIDLKTYSGGLKPIKLGGGKQTISVRFMNSDSIQYNLRSVEKFPEGAVPNIYKASWINDFAKDQISTSHPYGALTTPLMAQSLELFHTKPELYYTPYTPTLGAYIDDFGGRMGMIEVRPDEDLSSFKNFGYSENVVSTLTMLNHLRDDNDSHADIPMYLRNRLFDMLIGDWDRNEDQWRWAEYKMDSGALYKPIARDRDQVYTLYDGVIPWILSRKWAFRNFSNFDYSISDIKGLNFEARNLDRRLLNSLTRDEWQEQVRFIQTNLTDSVIEKAIHQLPEEVFPLSGPEIIAKLKQRRNELEEYADAYYNFLAKEVDIVASDDEDYFQVNRLDDSGTRVRMFKKDKKKLLFDRTFLRAETKEIRLYGLEEQDKFNIEGDVDKGIKIRIIGGADSDSVIDKSHVSNGKELVVYDNPEDRNGFNVGNDGKIRLSDKPYINEYALNSFNYNYTGPRLSIEYNEDDGVYIGGGIKIRRHGFRKDPSRMELSLLGHVALQTHAFNFTLGTTWYSLFAHLWDLKLDARVNSPNYVINYFGEGNDTEESDFIDNNRVGLSSISITPSIQKRVGQFMTLRWFTGYSHVDIDEPENSEAILSQLPDEMKYSTQPTDIGRLGFELDLILADHPVNPERGIHLNTKIDYHKDLKQHFGDFTRISSDLSLYFTPNIPLKITFASRVGFSTNLGDYYFYQSNFLGGLSNLRGYRRMRFAGKTSFYNNNEVRVKLIDVRNNILNGDMGIMGFTDIGQVWNEENDTSSLHVGYGPGVYLHFFNVFLVSATYGFSDEDGYFSLSTGFLF